MYDLTADRETKTTMRDIAVYRPAGMPFRKVALFITVPGIPDVKAALAADLITRRTKIIAVNHGRGQTEGQTIGAADPAIAASIRKSLGKMGFDYVMVDKPLESREGIAAIQAAVKKWGKIDYSFLDFCGMISGAIASALHELQGHFSPKARIALTVCTLARQRRTIDRYITAFDGEFDRRALQLLTATHASEWVSDAFSYVGVGSRITVRDQASVRRVNDVSNFVWQWQAVTAALDGWDVEVCDAKKYREDGRMNMGLVVFDLKKHTTLDDDCWGFDSIEDVCSLSKPQCHDAATTAAKAWATRRLRYGKTGTQKKTTTPKGGGLTAGQKAWQTRVANVKAAAATKRAKKAWRTRRRRENATA